MKTTIQQVAAYARLVGYCNTLGPVYKPSKANIKIAALNATLTQAQGSIDAAIKFRNAFEDAVKARKQVFAQAQPMTTRIVSALIASGASDETIAYARGIKRVFSGSVTRRLSPKTATVNAPVAEGDQQSITQSVSQRGYDIMATNFARLVERLATEPLYEPNEVDLQLTSLKAFLKALRNANSNVLAATLAMKNERTAQGKLLYGKAGLHGTALDVKAYIKSIFGAKSTEYKEVGPLKFFNKNI